MASKFTHFAAPPCNSIFICPIQISAGWARNYGTLHFQRYNRMKLTKNRLTSLFYKLLGCSLVGTIAGGLSVGPCKTKKGGRMLDIKGPFRFTSLRIYMFSTINWKGLLRANNGNYYVYSSVGLQLEVYLCSTFN